VAQVGANRVGAICAYQKEGHLEDAEKLQEEVLKNRKEIVGDDSPDN